MHRRPLIVVFVLLLVATGCLGDRSTTRVEFTAGPVPYTRDDGPADEALWLLTESGAGYRITVDGRVDRRFRMPATAVPAFSYLAVDLAVGDGRLWITTSEATFTIRLADAAATPVRLAGLRGAFSTLWHDGALWYSGNGIVGRALPDARGDVTTETVETYSGEFADLDVAPRSRAMWLWRGPILTAIDGQARRDIAIPCRDAAAEDPTYTWAVTDAAMVYSCDEGLLRVVTGGTPERVDDGRAGQLVTDGHRTVWRFARNGTGITDMTLMTSSSLEITAHDVGGDLRTARRGWTRSLFSCRQRFGGPEYPAGLAGGSLWVIDDCLGSHRVVALDPATGAIRHDVLLKDDDQPRQLVTGPNSAWVLATTADSGEDEIIPRRGLVAYRFAADGTWTRTVIDPDDRSIRAATAVQLTG